MKYDVTYSQNPCMIVATFHDSFDMKDCLEAATEARKAADEKGCNVLYDLRAAQIELSTADYYEWPRTISAQEIKLPSKLACLCLHPSERILFFETAAQNAGQNVRIFTDYDKAVQWVAVTHQEDPTRNQHEESPTG